MKRRILLVGLMLFFAFFHLNSCANDDDFGKRDIHQSVVAFSAQSPDIRTYKKMVIEVVEINTGAVETVTIENSAIELFTLLKGAYRLTMDGEAVTHDNEAVRIGGTATLDARNRSEDVLMDVRIKQFNQDFIIEEVFYAGVKTPEGKNYNSSRYFKLTNNTDTILYADGLLIGQSEFLTIVNNQVSPYRPELAFPVKGLMMLPGNGTDYPIASGDFMVVADNAINHHAITSTAFDLSGADFEFPTVANPALGHVDNPNVPNVEVIYTKANFNMIFLHSSGVESYVIARFPKGENSATFLEKYSYTYSYTNAAGNITTRSAYELPNAWIVDGVNNSTADRFLHLLTSPSIDAGWTGVGAFWNDANRLGKSVRRKVLGTMWNGKTLYKDTNNSTNDFIKNAEPSLKKGIVH